MNSRQAAATAHTTMADWNVHTSDKLSTGLLGTVKLEAYLPSVELEPGAQNPGPSWEGRYSSPSNGQVWTAGRAERWSCCVHSFLPPYPQLENLAACPPILDHPFAGSVAGYRATSRVQARPGRAAEWEWDPWLWKWFPTVQCAWGVLVAFFIQTPRREGHRQHVWCVLYVSVWFYGGHVVWGSMEFLWDLGTSDTTVTT